MRRLALFGFAIELAGVIVMLAFALESYVKFRRGTVTWVSVSGPLFVALGLGIAVGRDTYFGIESILPLTVGTSTLGISFVLVALGIVMMIRGRYNPKR